MAILRFRRFTKPQTLKRIGRELLARFFERFADELQARKIVLPSTTLPETEYFQALAAVLLSPEGLPDGLNEALYAIDDLASAEGQERLQTALAEAGLELDLPPDSSPEDLAVQVWLAAPSLLARKHNEQRLLRLSVFQYFGGGRAPGQRAQVAPAPETLPLLSAGLDAWFARHQRGRDTARVELYRLQGEYWFLVRHGDAFARAPKVESQRTEIIHFRPERDDVVVYSPEHDEIRINARTKGERDLYREQFGLWLHGQSHYFSERKTYTLEPLRLQGADALTVEGLDGISKIVLRELEVAWDNLGGDVLTRGAADVFLSAALVPGQDGPVPKSGRLARAAFEFHFPDSPRPRPVEIRPPNLLKLGRHCDLQRVDRWLWARGFRVNEVIQRAE